MTDAGTIDWRPSASRARLAQRAELLAATRDFFGERRLLEVETPMLVGAAVTDTHLESVPARVGTRTMHLHTSPEYAMKRLLAAGSGDIWQLCRVARGDERSSLHNPEFTLLEWYRCGWSMAQLIDEVAALLDALCLRAGAARRPLVVRRYADAFREMFGVDPLTASDAALGALARDAGLENGSRPQRHDGARAHGAHARRPAGFFGRREARPDARSRRVARVDALARLAGGARTPRS